jgi:hypothetical protein
MGVFTIKLEQGDVQTDLFSRDQNNEGILFPGDSLYSPGQAFRCTFQSADGNVVIERILDEKLPTQQWAPIWSLITNLGQDAIATDMQVARFTMQFDGNLVRNDANAAVKWASGTQGNQGAFLRMQDDGNLVIYTGDGRAIWSTNTYAGPWGRPNAGPI